MRIIGIDCATQDKNTGLALATYDGDTENADVVRTQVGNEVETTLDAILHWLEESGEPTLLALDAPLGWPSPMGETLLAHRAGEPIAVEADQLFFRRTDQQVWHSTLKKPMEVGADRIARTAHSALRLLGEIRRSSGHAIPLAWSWRQISQDCAIEVYPAGTLKALNLHDLGEPGDDALSRPERAIRKKDRALRKLNSLRLKGAGPLDKKSVHELDAMICVAAAVDFFKGCCVSPTTQQINTARREGWIWVRKRAD